MKRSNTPNFHPNYVNLSSVYGGYRKAKAKPILASLGKSLRSMFKLKHQKLVEDRLMKDEKYLEEMDKIGIEGITGVEKDAYRKAVVHRMTAVTK